MSTETGARHELSLAGCTSVPLAGYLKALGTFRIVSEQADGEATGHWADARFVLSSRLGRGDLEHLLLEEYRPTPIVAPWNGGGGFYFREELRKDPGSGKNVRTGRRTQETTATRTLEAITESRAQRLNAFRQVIQLSKKTLAAMSLDEAPSGAKQKARKLELIRRLRSELPDTLVDWLDVSVVLAGDRVEYPPLLGSGGTDGNLDFTTNFMQRLGELIDPETGAARPRAAEWLRGALFDEPIPGLTGGAIGQFAPGSAGGPNASTGYGGSGQVNPWDFVLMLEGAVLFAAATTRRLDAGSPGALSFPFTVRPLGAGAGSAARGEEGDARGEMWLPLWHRPVGIEELRTLLAEGRATVHRRTARDGLDFVRAVSGLGIDRGITAFERYVFLQRLGNLKLAVNFGRIRVRPDPRVSLVDQLEANGYLERLGRFSRSKEASSSIRRLVSLLEGALFDLARHGGRRRLQEVLMVLGELQQVVGTSPTARDRIRPLPALSHQWVRDADDGTHEFRLAAALAGLHAPGLPMRCHLAPVSPEEGTRRRWEPESRLAVWGAGDLVSNLGRVLERRLLEAERRDLQQKPFGGQPPADVAAVAAFLRGDTDDRRIARLVGGLAFTRSPESLPERPRVATPVPAAFAVLKPLFVADSLLQFLDLVAAGVRIPLPSAVAASLLAGHVDDALATAWRRLRVAGADLPRYPMTAPAAAGLSGRRLAAALMIPLRTADLGRLVRQVTLPSKQEIEEPGHASDAREGRNLTT